MTSISGSRPTYARTDLDRLAFNYRSIRQFIGEGPRILAVVKANAYGHSAVDCSIRLAAEGVDWFGVALAAEGTQLRSAGIEQPILVLGGFWEGQESEILERRLTPVISSIEQARLLDDAARHAETIVDYHLKIDTGMGRVGVRSELINQVGAELRLLDNICLRGVMTHFAAADDLGEELFTRAQIARFDASVKVLRSMGFDPEFVDLANSPGTFAYPDSRRSMVRLGGVLYGLGDDVLPTGIPVPDLRPVLSVTSAIGQVKNVPAGETLGYGRTFRTVRDSVIATIPIGYADGYPRSMSNAGRVIVRGRYAPVVGRVSMDWTIVDVTEIQHAAVGDMVTIIGEDGDLSITAEEVASVARTISYEITCGITRRVTRVILGLEG